MAVPDFQRARSAAAKQLRESAILEAARALGAERGIRQITLTDIAEAIGMHKSAMLRYFETREEIFLRLTADGWREWSKALRAGLEELAAPTSAAVAGVFASTLAARGLFCDLLAQAPLNLERHVSLDTVRAFKLVTLAEVDAIVAVVRRLLPGLTERDCVNLIAAATAMSVRSGRWRHPGLRSPRFTGATLGSPTRSSTSNRASPGCWRPCWTEHSPPGAHPDEPGTTVALRGELHQSVLMYSAEVASPILSDPPSFARLAGHPLRWRLLGELARSDRRVRELVRLVDQPQNLVSYHLGRLRTAGLVGARRSTFDARDAYYHLDLVKCADALAAVGLALHPGLLAGPGAGRRARPSLPGAVPLHR